MGTYMGNVGNLMQHWTLCEILNVANKHICGLNYIDAHAMAPLAANPKNPNRVEDRFARVQGNLPGQDSVYERAWYRLVQGQGPVYPSSAAFVQQIWDGPCALLLCENHAETANEIRRDLPEAELHEGDWRERFEDPLRNPLPNPTKGSLTLVSFDPDKYDRHPRANRNIMGHRNLYPKDLELVMKALEGVDGATLLQVSTYSQGGGNPQEEVRASINEILCPNGFTLAAVVRAKVGMMSLVYARGVDWAAELAGLPDGFTNWLGVVERMRR